MSENMTPQEGNGSLSVDQAAGALLGLMGGEDSQEQPDTAQEAEEVTQEAQSDDEQSDSDGDVEEQEQVEEKPRYKVKASGEEIEVTLDDLIKGYQREADYTKKTQTLAEQRKQVESERQVIEQAKTQRDQYQERLAMIESALRTYAPQENLEALKETDPIGYAVKVAEQTQREKQLQAVQMERARIAQQQQAEQSQNLNSHLAVEAQKLAEAIPEYADEQKSVQVKKDIRDYARKIGWSDEELASVYDSRAVLTLYRAMQYEKLMGNKAGVTKKVNEAPKMLKPGVSRQTDVNSEQTKKAMNQLKRTGKVRDAANAFERFI
tara:strand:- start:1168 stop:2133 length:966 start_codon:yes stop_codon:yes gene_type:complete